MASRGAVHLLLGPEEGEKASFLESIIADVASSSGSRPEILRFYASQGGLPAFLDSLRTGDLFASSRVAVFLDIEELAKNDIDELARYLASPAPEVTAILCSSASSLGTREAARRLESLIPGSNRKVFWELFEGQKMAWLMRFFGSRKIGIDPAAAEYLIDVVQGNTRDLRAECEKLALYHGPGASIALETVEQFIFHSKEENAFTLFDRLAERTFEGSLEVLERLELSPGFEGVALFAALLSQFRRLLGLKLSIEEGLGLEAAFTRAGIYGKRNQQSFKAAHRCYSLEEVRSIIALTVDTDRELRSYRSELQGQLLRLYLYRVTVRGGRGGAGAETPRSGGGAP